MHLDDDAGQRLADRALLLRPFMAIDEDAAAFGCRVILEDHRPEPGDGAFLDMCGTGRGAVQDPAQGRGVVFRFRGFRQLQHPVQHGRHHMRVRDAVFGNQTQRFFRVPFVHQHATDAGIERETHIERQRCCVIERAGDQRQIAVAEGRRLGQLDQQRRNGCGLLAIDALGMAGRARGVHHLRAEHGIGNVAALFGFDRHVIGGKARQGAANRELRDQALRLARRFGGRGRKARIGDEGLRLAIVDDIGDFRALEVPVDRRQAETAALAGDHRFDEFRPVGTEQRHRVAGLQARPPERAHQPIGARVELAITAIAGLRHNRRPVRGLRRMPGHHHAGRRGLFAAPGAGRFHHRHDFSSLTASLRRDFCFVCCFCYWTGAGSPASSHFAEFASAFSRR